MDPSSFSVRLLLNYLTRLYRLRLPAELPFALPPGRFEDPVPLPQDYRYELKEYIRETACKFGLGLRPAKESSSEL